MLKLKLQSFGHLMWRALIWKDLDTGKDWGQEEKGTTQDEMFGWHHQLSGHGCGWTPVMDREAWRAVVHGVAKSWTRWNGWTELRLQKFSISGFSFLIHWHDSILCYVYCLDCFTYIVNLSIRLIVSTLFLSRSFIILQVSREKYKVSKVKYTLVKYFK